ncbi:MAG: hypothetical protein ACP5QO_10345, partial [Clostridia bacterium]
MLSVLVLAAILLTAHELGHIFTTVGFGGHFRGIVFRGIAAGVSLDLSGLSLRRRMGTVWAGTGAELFVAVVITGLALAGVLDMHLLAWTLVIVAADATLNLGP